MCCNLIKSVKKIVYLALWSGEAGGGGDGELKLGCAIYEWPLKKSIFTYSKNQLKKLKIIINRLHNRNKVALKKFKGLVMTAVLMASETTIG